MTQDEDIASSPKGPRERELDRELGVETCGAGRIEHVVVPKAALEETMDRMAKLEVLADIVREVGKVNPVYRVQEWYRIENALFALAPDQGGAR